MATPEYFGPVLPGMPPLGPGPAAAPVDPNAQLFQIIAQLLKPQPQAPGPDLGSLIGQIRNDPQGDQNKRYQPGVPNSANPFTNGFFSPTAPSSHGVSPEARIASQGRSAVNQWAQQGGVPGVDPGVLANLMGGMTQIPGPQATPNAETSDPFFQRRMGMGPYSPDNMFDGLMKPIPQNGMTPYGPVEPPVRRRPTPRRQSGPMGSPSPGFNFRF